MHQQDESTSSENTPTITDKNLGTIKMEPDAQMLDKVVVKAVLPKTEIIGDAFVTNIENSVLAEAGSANDVLKMLPGVIQKNDGIEVFGKGVDVVQNPDLFTQVCARQVPPL